MVFNATCNTILAISWQVNFIGGEKLSREGKPPTYRKSLYRCNPHNKIVKLGKFILKSNKF